MAVGNVQLGSISISKLVLGGNPFSGFSHQNPDRDVEMRHYFTTARIKETMRDAESLGINAFLGRADRHIIRTLEEYWNEGGKIQWLAQSAPEFAPHTRSITNAAKGGASAAYVHGGQMDFWLAQEMFDEIRFAVDTIKNTGLPAGVAGHTTRVFEWAEENLDLDFYMCCYHNPTPRGENAEHVHGAKEHFGDEDRDAMVKLIAQLGKPAIHYKVFAAGRKDPAEAMDFVAQHLRPQDAVCIGVFPKDKPDMLREDLDLLQTSLARAGKQ